MTFPSSSTLSITWSFSVGREKPGFRSKVTSRKSASGSNHIFTILSAIAGCLSSRGLSGTQSRRRRRQPLSSQQHKDAFHLPLYDDRSDSKVSPENRQATP